MRCISTRCARPTAARTCLPRSASFAVSRCEQRGFRPPRVLELEIALLIRERDFDAAVQSLRQLARQDRRMAKQSARKKASVVHPATETVNRGGRPRASGARRDTARLQETYDALFPAANDRPIPNLWALHARAYRLSMIYVARLWSADQRDVAIANPEEARAWPRGDTAGSPPHPL